MDTTELDGTIEGAIASLIQPEEPVEETEYEPEESDDEVVEVEDEEVDEPEDVEDEDEPEEQDDEDADEDETQEPELYTVKVDGKEEQVTLDDLKRGYSGQKYVQKGMQEAAAMRKQVEEVYAALLNERQQVAQVSQMVQQGGLPTPPQQPSKEMFNADPIGYMEAKLKYDEDIVSYQSQMAQIQEVVQKQSQAQEVAQRAYLQQEMETLKQVIPEFSDPAKASQVRDRLVTMGQEVYGYNPEEISAVMDHRAIRVLNDAIKYQELMKGKAKAEKTAKPKNRRTVKAGAKKTASNAQADRQTRSKLKQSGSINDALGLILQS